MKEFGRLSGDLGRGLGRYLQRSFGTGEIHATQVCMAEICPDEPGIGYGGAREIRFVHLCVLKICTAAPAASSSASDSALTMMPLARNWRFVRPDPRRTLNHRACTVAAFSCVGPLLSRLLSHPILQMRKTVRRLTRFSWDRRSVSSRTQCRRVAGQKEEHQE